MTAEPKTIRVTAETDLPTRVDDAAAGPLILERGCERFRLSRDEGDSADPWANYDPERVREGLRRFAGTITPEEGERMKGLIYRGREEGTRPPDRP
jgi:hypothetical protein